MIWWMLQNCVVTAILAGGVWAVCRVGRIGPAGRHALWLVLLVKLIAPPLVSWPWAITHVSVPLGMKLPPMSPASARAETSVGAVVSERAHTPSSATGPSDGFSDWLWPAMKLVWLSGCAGFVLLQGKRIRMMLRVLRTSEPANPELTSLVEEAARRVRTRAVDTRVAAGIASPFIWCIHRPRLLWPAALSKDVPEEAIRGLLVHELAHLKRRDHWVGWLELVAGCFWWWNPLYWYICRQLRDNAELACDAWVVDAMDSVPGGRRAYAEALLAVSESISIPMTAVGANTGNRRFLERRLTMILRDRFPIRLSRAGVLIVALIVAVSVPMWTLKAAPEISVAQVALPLTSKPAAPAVAQAARAVTAAPVAPAAAQGLPADAEELVKQFEEHQAEIRRTTETTLDQQRQQLIEKLQALQDTATKAGLLDEAVAVRDQVRRLQSGSFEVVPGLYTGYVDRISHTVDRVSQNIDRINQNVISRSDGNFPFTIRLTDSTDKVALPGDFYYLNSGLILQLPLAVMSQRGRNGESFELEVTASSDFAIWGTGVYTDDSPVETVAVHAGLLKPGERGKVLVTILPGRSSYEGSVQNGVRSQPFESYEGSYRIERTK